MPFGPCWKDAIPRAVASRSAPGKQNPKILQYVRSFQWRWEHAARTPLELASCTAVALKRQKLKRRVGFIAWDGFDAGMFVRNILPVVFQLPSQIWKPGRVGKCLAQFTDIQTLKPQPLP